MIRVTVRQRPVDDTALERTQAQSSCNYRTSELEMADTGRDLFASSCVRIMHLCDPERRPCRRPSAKTRAPPFARPPCPKRRVRRWQSSAPPGRPLAPSSRSTGTTLDWSTTMRCATCVALSALVPPDSSRSHLVGLISLPFRRIMKTRQESGFGPERAISSLSESSRGRAPGLVSMEMRYE